MNRLAPKIRSDDNCCRVALTDRRRFLADTGMGLGVVALAWLLDRDGYARADSTSSRIVPSGSHFQPRANRAIHIFCPGGVSHVDSFDFKPELERLDGKSLEGKGPIDTFFGRPGNLLKSLYAFQKRGQSGLWVSELFPHLATCVDDLVFLYS